MSYDIKISQSIGLFRTRIVRLFEKREEIRVTAVITCNLQMEFDKGSFGGLVLSHIHS